MPEVRWRASGFTDNGTCVEVADLPDGVLVRDTKDRTRPPLRCSPEAWAAFVAGVKLGEFD